jgi:hypothetical protein
MPYTYQGKIYSVKSPVTAISVNNHNIVITDQEGPKLFKFTNKSESKGFLAWLYQA